MQEIKTNDSSFASHFPPGKAKVYLNPPLAKNAWEKDFEAQFAIGDCLAAAPVRELGDKQKYAEFYREIKEISQKIQKGVPQDGSLWASYASELTVHKARVNELAAESYEFYLNKLSTLVGGDAMARYAKHKLKFLQELEKSADMKDELMLEKAIDRLNSSINAQLRILNALVFQRAAEFRALKLAE